MNDRSDAARKSSRSSKRSPSSNDLLNELCNLAFDRMDDLIDHLEVDLRKYGKRYTGPCPVHGGGGRGGVSVYADGYATRGNWQCHSRKCEGYFKRSLVGFTRGVLSHARYGWSREGDQEASMKEAVDVLCGFLGISLAEVKVDPSRADRHRFRKTVEILSPTGRPVDELCTQRAFHNSHRVPSPYYLERGFASSTLTKFEVGECTYRASPNFGRTIIPIYDGRGEIIVGALSRSPHPRCKACKDCHDPAIPCSKEKSAKVLRWRVVPDGFNDKHHLYNLWRSRSLIVKSKCVVVVEGAGDLWRLDEAGIYNTVGLFGSSPSAIQEIALEECSPAHVVLMTDDDEAGNACAEAMTRKWSRLASVHRVKPIGRTEISEMSTEDVRSRYRGLIEGWMR
jgi:5S rRNA maturation endonuclease (ribonuclease M5)